MITNERQYRITKAQLSKLLDAVRGYDTEAATVRTGSSILAQAELDALKSEVEVLSGQLSEYENLKSGAVKVLKANSLEELPRLLVKGRIAQGLTQGQLAKKLKLKEQQVQRYESEEYATASLKRLAEIAKALQLNVTEVAEVSQESPRFAATDAKTMDWCRFPVREMYRRNWFRGFSGSLSTAEKEAELLVEPFVRQVLQRPAVALHRKRVRSGSDVDVYALLAWQCRILSLADECETEGVFTAKSIDKSWVKSLVQESRFEDGPLRAQKKLRRAGISLVIEPHLPHTHLDGAAFLHGGKPVIGLSLRYDRLDNFWFVLLHELIHITEHLRKGRVESIFDDIDFAGDELEREADVLAGQALIPNDVWETALARYVRSEESIVSLAKSLKISPAIIAGRIRNEANNYTILTNMVGQGEVRRQFPDATFG